MTTGIGVSTALAAGAATGMLAAIDAAGTAARLQLYGAPRPDYGGTPGAAVLVADVLLPFPAGTVVSGALVLTVPSQPAFALAAVEPTWARLLRGDGAWLADFRARLTTTPEDPADPAQVVVQAGALAVGTFLRVGFGQIALPLAMP